MSYVGTEFRFGGAATIQVADSAASTQVPPSLATARFVQLVGTLTATRTVVIATQPGWDWVFQNSASQIVNVAAQSGGTTVSLAPSVIATIVSTSTGMIIDTGATGSTGPTGPTGATGPTRPNNTETSLGSSPYTVPSVGDYAIQYPTGGFTVKAFASPNAGDIFVGYANSDGATATNVVDLNGKNYRGSSSNPTLPSSAWGKFSMQFVGGQWV